MLFNWYPDGIEAAEPWPTIIEIHEALLYSSTLHVMANSDIRIECINGQATYEQLGMTHGYNYGSDYGPIIVGRLTQATYEPTC